MKHFFSFVIAMTLICQSTIGFSEISKDRFDLKSKDNKILKVEAKDISIDFISVMFKKFEVQIYGVDFNKFVRSKDKVYIKGDYDRIKFYPISKNKKSHQSINPAVLNDVSVDWDFDRGDFLWSGAAKVTVDDFIFNEAKIKDLDFSLESIKKSKTSELLMSLAIKKSVMKQGEFGPMAMSLNLKGLKNKNLIKISKISRLSSNRGNSKEVMRQVLLSGFKGVFKFNSGNDDDKIKINAEVIFPAQKHVSLNKLVPKSLVDKIYVKAEVVMTEEALEGIVKNGKNGKMGKGLKPHLSFLEGHSEKHLSNLSDAKIEKKINAWVASGMLKKKGGNYIINFVMKKGVIKINGHKIK